MKYVKIFEEFISESSDYSNWGKPATTATNNKDFNELYAMFPDNHIEAKNIWNKLSQAQKDSFIEDLNQGDAASEHMSDSWLEFINSKSYEDWLENATNWDEE